MTLPDHVFNLFERLFLTASNMMITTMDQPHVGHSMSSSVSCTSAGGWTAMVYRFIFRIASPAADAASLALLYPFLVFALRPPPIYQARDTSVATSIGARRRS